MKPIEENDIELIYQAIRAKFGHTEQGDKLVDILNDMSEYWNYHINR